MSQHKPIMQPKIVASRTLHVQGDFHIGIWLIQPQLHTIAANRQVIQVEPKAMQVLVYLAEHADQVVPKERLIGAVWADTFVTDDVLTRCISDLRKAFNDDAKDPKVIATVPRSGYRLVAQVQGTQSEPAAPRKRFRWSMALGVTAGLAMLVIALYFGVVRGRMGRSTPPFQIHSLVVLPLANLSGDPEQEYFADGMTGELITDLAQIGELRVISRTSAMTYKGQHKPLPEIARELNVDAVVDGSVQRSGGRVRISAELIDARNDRHLWAQSYERDLRDVLPLQGEVASAIVREIRGTLTPQEEARLAGAGPLSPEAHEAYLQGRYFWSRLTEESVRKSIEYYQRAIQLAPAYAPAYAGLAFSYNLLASTEYAPPRETYAKAKQWAQQALEKDENLSEAHAALGFALCYGDWNWPAAETEFKRAIELNPNDVGAHHVYAFYLGDMGRTEEAIAEMRKAIELDPLSILVHSNLGFLYLQTGQPEKAIEQFKKILEMDPNSSEGHRGLGTVYTSQGRHAEAIAEWREAKRLDDATYIIAGLGYAYAAAGKKSEAHQVLSDLLRMSPGRYVSAVDVAAVYAGLGEKEQAFQWLEKALEEHSDELVSLKVISGFASLRSDPRFQQIVSRVGLT